VLPPALQRPPTGQGLGRKLLAQLEVDEASAPGRMFAFEGQGGFLHGLRKSGVRGAALRIGGLETSSTVDTIALPEGTHAAITDLQLLGNRPQGLPSLMAL